MFKFFGTHRELSCLYHEESQCELRFRLQSNECSRLIDWSRN